MKLDLLTLEDRSTLISEAKEPFRQVADLRDSEFSTEDREAVAARLAACWNACHGLDLPDAVPPGILADAVAMLSRCLAALETPGDLNPTEILDVIEDAGELLAALQPGGPVSPPEPYGWAWKTEKGYLAAQGRETWFESSPVGWALMGDRGAAEGMGKTYGIPGRVVPVSMHP